MTVDETKGIIEMLRDSMPKFYVKAETAAVTWHKILGQYSISEMYDSASFHISSSDEPPTPRLLAHYCDRKRREEKQRAYNLDAMTQYRTAEASFESIPGKNRAQKVLYVCAQRSAESWKRDGKNEFHGSMLLNARSIGIEFEGIDYSEVENCDSEISGAIVKMALSANYNGDI